MNGDIAKMNNDKGLTVKAGAFRAGFSLLRLRRWHCGKVRSLLAGIVLVAILVNSHSMAEDTKMANERGRGANCWQRQAVEYARIMSRVKWTPVAEGMPIKGKGFFEKGKEYTGVPYSSVKSVGRYIGFDIYLKTFLAAVENPRSVLYTENLSGKVPNAASYYGKVCSSYTSYALQCGIWYVSRLHGPPHRSSVMRAPSPSAQTAEVGDVIYTPPAKPGGGSHVEIVTDITRDEEGKVTHVLVEESSPPTTRTINRDVENYNSHISSKGRRLYRITDLDEWRGGNRAESFLFPNYKEDSKTPVINRVLLLDRGDWVAYHKDQPVKINVMDRGSRGVKTLVIKRGGAVVEEIALRGPGVVERAFSICGDYTAHCVMKDGTLSRACEFSVCDLDFRTPAKKLTLGKALEIDFTSENMNVIIVYVNSGVNSYAHHSVFVTEQDRRKGRVVIPAELLQEKGQWQFWLIGENRYGRLKKRRDIMIAATPRTGK
jgi:hypothetical protein